jgi:putative Holliday junction resolvase
MITDDASDFAKALPESGGALMALDLGTKTIGLATCDAGWRFATPATTLKRSKFSKDVGAIKAEAESRSICGLVLGLPRNMDGSEGPRAQSSRAYARNLEQHLDLPILLWDERWSTQSAEAAMIESDLSRAKRAEQIDAQAAAVILQGVIDRLAGGIL